MTQRDAEWVKAATPEQIETAFFNQELDEYMRGTQDPARVALIASMPTEEEIAASKGMVLLDGNWVMADVAALLLAARAAGKPEHVTSDELTAQAQAVLDAAGPQQRDAEWLKTATQEQIAEAYEKGELANLLSK